MKKIWTNKYKKLFWKKERQKERKKKRTKCIINIFSNNKKKLKGDIFQIFLTHITDNVKYNRKDTKEKVIKAKREKKVQK